MRVVGLAAVVVVALATMFACDDGGTAVACQTDPECPTGFACRDLVCAPVTSDGGASDDAGTTCGAETASCFTTTDCCTGSCTGGTCTSAVVPTQPTCVGVSGQCQDDCCEGLTCRKGVCQ